MRLLVVDDDTTVRMILAMALDEVEVLEGWRVASVLDDAIGRRVDAVVVDRKLPDGDGTEAVRALRAAAQTEHLPIVVITADDDPSLRERSFAAGADEHVVKPLDPDRLLALLRAIEATPPLERRLRRTVRRARLHVGRDDGGDVDLVAALLTEAEEDARGGRRRRRRKAHAGS